MIYKNKNIHTIKLKLFVLAFILISVITSYKKTEAVATNGVPIFVRT